jgi:hypothetical protein
MVRRLTFLLALVAPLIPAAVSAQTPRVELFGGYSLLPADNQDFPRATSHGVQGAVAVSLNDWVGVFGEVGVQFSTARDLGPGFAGLVARTRVTEWLVGPRFVARSDRINVFGHALFGIAIGGAGEDFEGFSDSGITFGGGGGVDVRVAPRVAVRAQVDLIGSFADIVEGNSRLALGVVLRR